MPQTVKKSRVTVTLTVIVLSAAAIAVETWLWSSRKYYLTSVIIILLAMLPFFARFEGRRPQVREIVLLAVMTAFAVAGRVAFYWAPQFKPVCAIVILTAAAFNAEAGFITGAAAGLISNMFLNPSFEPIKKGREGDLGKNEYTTLNSDMIKKMKDTIPIPILDNGSYDIEKQKELAIKYEKLENIKLELMNKIIELTNIVIA